MLPVANPASRWLRVALGLHKAGRKLAASTSPLTPTRHRATNGSLKVRIETRWRTTTRNNQNKQQQRQRRYEGKKQKPLDASDLLIET
jgi:Skp family chaperone for outer membrane proteins